MVFESLVMKVMDYVQQDKEDFYPQAKIVGHEQRTIEEPSDFAFDEFFEYSFYVKLPNYDNGLIWKIKDALHEYGDCQEYFDTDNKDILKVTLWTKSYEAFKPICQVHHVRYTRKIEYRLCGSQERIDRVFPTDWSMSGSLDKEDIKEEIMEDNMYDFSIFDFIKRKTVAQEKDVQQEILNLEKIYDLKKEKKL